MKKILVGLVAFFIVAGAAQAGTSIWGATDRGPAVGTMRFPVDTGASSGPGYLTLTETNTFIDANLNLTGDVTTTNGVATTLATVNSNVGSFGSTSAIPQFTVDAKGRITAASNQNPIAAPIANLTGGGTGVVTALGTNVGTAGAFVVNGGALGTVSSGILTNATGYLIDNLADASYDSSVGFNMDIGQKVALHASAIYNTFIGYQAGATAANSTANTRYNTFIGYTAGANLTGGDSNVGVGSFAMSNLTSGITNVAMGDNALHGVGTGSSNTGIGDDALQITSGDNNTALGYHAGANIGSGHDNTLIGFQGGGSVSGAGSSNIMIGEYNNITTGSGNIIIGNSLVTDVAATSNQIDIGDVITATGIDTPSTSATNIAGSMNVVGALTKNGSAVQTALTTAQTKVKTLGFSATTPTTGIQGTFAVAPCAGTITAFDIIADAGTATVQTYKIATGTTAPTVSNSISTAGVQLSTGTAIHSTSLGDFTTLTVAANDMFQFNLSAVATATKLYFDIQITCTN